MSGALTARARAATLLATLTLGGCAGVGDLLHAAAGHLEVMGARRPIAEVMADPATPAALAATLAEVAVMREFAIGELALPAGGSYRHYADLGRDVVVWSVVATPALSLKPRLWCYPVVGCLSYRGFFDPARAEALMATLRAEGMDVYAAPVQAYSTLGWFDDPMLNTLLRGPSWATAGIIFHELAHRRLYVAGDTAFNEAYAVAVQEVGERRWLARHASEQQRASHARHVTARDAFLDLVSAARAELEALYALPLSDAEKRSRKRDVLRALRGRYASLRVDWGGNRGYDRWFGQDLNNAKLALVSTYNDLVPRFHALLTRLGGDMAAFHAEVARLAIGDAASRRAALPPLD